MSSRNTDAGIFVTLPTGEEVEAIDPHDCYLVVRSRMSEEEPYRILYAIPKTLPVRVQITPDSRWAEWRRTGEGMPD